MASEPRLLAGGMLAVAGCLAIFSALVVWGDYHAWAGAMTFLVILGVSYPLCRHLADLDDEPRLVWILMGALCLKLIMSLVRYFVIYRLYDGFADATVYHNGAVDLFGRLREGDLSMYLGEELEAFPEESQRIGLVAAGIYTLTGPTIFGGFFVFSWLSFLGSVLMTRGLRWGIPEGHHLRYTVLILFLPSMLFWPSSIGKEGWMMLCLGVIAYGAGRFLGPGADHRGLLAVAVGIAGAMLIRPHVAFIAAGALAFGLLTAVLVSPSAIGERSSRQRGVRIAALVLIVILGFFASTRVLEFFDGGGEAVLSAEGALQETRDRTFLGGSKFEAEPVSSPLDLPGAVVSVLFRPYPWEAASVPVLISALESLLFLALVLRYRASLQRLPGTLRRRPYLAFCLGYSLAFVVAFSNIANAGILARQRIQMFPFLLVIFALPATRWWETDQPETPRSASPNVLWSNQSEKMATSHSS